MTTRAVLFGVIGIWLGAAIPCAVSAERPNVVLILCDNLGYGDVGCYGSKLHRTPHIDRLAEEGLRFTNAYASSGVCTPSRASLMTGCYPRRVNLHVSDKGRSVLQPVAAKGLHPEEVTIAELLQSKDYATAIFGKWHLGDQPPFLPTRQGFDTYLGIPYSDDMTARPGQPWPPLPLMKNEQVIEAPVDRNLLTKRYTEATIDFITEHREEPFFVYLAHAMPGSTKSPFASDAFRGRSRNGPWGDAVEEIDWSTGEILQALERLDLDRKTLVIWTNDNGAPRRNPPQGSNQPLKGWGYDTSEGAMRVPLFARWPGRIPTGRVCGEVCTLMDLYPTLAKLVGAEVPQDRIIDGRDVWPLLAGQPEAKSPHEAFYYYFMDQLQAVRSGQWKLYLELEAPQGRAGAEQFRTARLYDLDADPRETANVADRHPEVVEKLLQYAQAAREDLGDGDQAGRNQRPAGHVANPTPRELPTKTDVSAVLGAVDSDVLREGESLRSMLWDDVRARLQAANRRSTERWREVQSREDWEQLRKPWIDALRKSLGEFPPAPPKLRVHTTGVLEGEGFRIEKLIYETRPGLLVTANLYTPSDPPASMPGLLICHSHHAPKTQSELQDMGAAWARRGCLVLVPDQLGHGERRQHPFRTSDDFPADFRLSRQDYYFRYNVGLQLHLVGESLVGWMAWDMMRGVDLLLSRTGVDPDRIILLGAVAGGGDPAAVTAALDERIAAVVPFNFGGPQPETRYPLPDDAEDSFHYTGSGSWESTRNLRLSARDGFLPWVIVGSIAPRRLVYAHEFRWDRDRDPVWKRLQTLYNFYDARDQLAFAHGYGSLQGRPPSASHCTNIGPAHRKWIDPAFERWFGISPPETGASERRTSEELHCLSNPQPESLSLTSVYKLADRVAVERGERFRRQLVGKSPDEQRQILRATWSRLLGDIEPYTVTAETRGVETTGTLRVERLLLHGERGIQLPVLLLVPQHPRGKRLPLVVALAQAGKAGFLEHRTQLLTALLDGGVAVCLPDLRGCGESRPGDDRGRSGAATAISASELMLGQTLVGSRLKDLRSVLDYLRHRPEFDPQRIALYGDAFAPVNRPDSRLHVPLDLDQPHAAEPLGGLLALFGGLFEEDVAAVSARGGLASFRSLLDSEFLHVPHDAVIPGASTASDLSDIVAALTPRRVCIIAPVDGVNRRLSADEVRTAYTTGTPSPNFVVQAEPPPDRKIAEWLRGEE